MEPFDADAVVFHHLIDLPNSDCVFCSTVDTSTGRTRLFLIFHERNRIYVRNGVRDTWDELRDAGQYRSISRRYSRAVQEKNIPCFSA